MAQFRPLLQCLTLFFSVVALVIFGLVRIRSKGFPGGLVGAFSLTVHTVVFYVFVCLWEFDVFSITDYVNGLLGNSYISFGLWSAALRLHTSLELVLMAIAVYRRYVWTQGA